MSVGSIRLLYRRIVEILNPHYTSLLAIKPCYGSDNLGLYRFFTFARGSIHKTAVALDLLEPATPVKLTIVDGHVRAAVAHVCTSICHQVHRLDNRERLHMHFVADGRFVMTHGAQETFTDFPHTGINK